MSQAPEIPTTEDIFQLFIELDTVAEVNLIDESWMLIHGAEKSIALCPLYEAEDQILALEKGAELLDREISEIILADLPALFILRSGSPLEVRQEALLGSGFSQALPAIIQETLQPEFGDYQNISRADLGRLFSILLAEQTGNRNDSIDDPCSGEAFPPLWPQETKAELADAASKWLFRDNPDTVLDLCSGLGGFSAAIAARRQNTEHSGQYIVDHSIQQVEAHRLISAYTGRAEYPFGVQRVDYEDFIGRDRSDERTLDSFRSQSESSAGTEDRTSPPMQYDAVTAPICPGARRLPDIYKDRYAEFGLRGHRDFNNLLAAEGVSALSNSGRGVFVLSLGNFLREDLLEFMAEQGRIHAIMLLGNPQEEPFKDEVAAPQTVVVFFEKSSSKDKDSQMIRVTQIEEINLHPKTDWFLNAPQEDIEPNAGQEEGINFKLLAQKDLVEHHAKPLLFDPELVPIYESENSAPLECFVDMKHGVKTGANKFFYPQEDVLDEYQIPNWFLTPVLWRLSDNDNKYTITRTDIDQFAFDLREYLNTLEKQEEEVTEDLVIEYLESDGYHGVVEYILDNQELADRHTLQQPDIWFCPFWKSAPSSPDLVFRQRVTDGRWYTIELDDVIIDRTWYVIDCDERAKSLHRLLNSEPYQELLRYMGQPIGAGYLQFRHNDIKQLPIVKEIVDDLGEADLSFPPETRRDQRELDDAIVDLCTDSDLRDSMEFLMEPDDELAWAWFLSLSEYDEFRGLYEMDREAAEEYVSERVGENEIGEILETITQRELHKERWETLEELVEEYGEESFRLFMYGLTPQFEGVIMDWAEEEDGVEPDDTGDDFQIKISAKSPDGEDQEISKGLKNLIDTFLPRGFGDFLSDEIKEVRNDIAHGEVIESSSRQATICLLALNALVIQISRDKLGVSE